MTNDTIKNFVQLAKDPANEEQVAAALQEILPDYVRWVWGRDSVYRRWFNRWQAAGVTLMPNHYYSPVPDMTQLSDAAITRRSSMVGIDMNDSGQLELLGKLEQYKQEYIQFNNNAPNNEGRFFFKNGVFEKVDAEVLYCMIRLLKPKRVVEIGSGFSTLLSAAATAANNAEGISTELIAIEPYPNDILLNSLPTRTTLIREPVEKVPLSLFTELGENDIVFIDSTHVIRCGNDVDYEYFEILPRLKPGVVIHVHDIFLPLPYPSNWLKDEHIFWNEQYLLAAFLAFNDKFKVLWGGCHMHLNHPERLKSAFPGYSPTEHLPGSFWMKRVG
ncbi:class I SAM-dependent methyltransferase [Microvirga flavescens]|uniref:class I SAM-dependent methyltransferase n=1 Tax=Microvirga flavescens TaxID=2249811 RepID=UPI000DDB7238|nr:class I SAM-dependent methyltransferase [Microvirga flavescens]